MNSHASFWEAVKGALHSLRGSKLRSFLTLLGIILATTTLIAVMSVISGMDVYIAQNVSSMGADGYRVQDSPWLELVSGSGKFLYYEDVAVKGWPTLKQLHARIRAAQTK